METQNMFSKIPHQKLIVSGIIALVVFVAGFYAIHKDQFFGEERLPSQDLSNSAGEDDIDRDSDKDGLPDWKERLYGSDIYNMDSDGDGTTDGDEINNGRNPIKKAPNDELSYLKDPNFATSSTDINGIRKEFFAKYLAERSTEIKEVTFKDLMQKNVDPKKFHPTEELVDLNITSDNSDEALRKYINDFGTVIKKYSVRSHRTEDEILADITKDKNEALLKELQLPAISYRNFSKDLLALSVPSSVSKAHLLIVNGYDVMSRGLLEIQLMYKNPVAATAGYQAYMRFKFDVTTGYAALVHEVGVRQIIFESTEPGYLFYWNTVARSSATSSPKK